MEKQNNGQLYRSASDTSNHTHNMSSLFAPEMYVLVFVSVSFLYVCGICRRHCFLYKIAGLLPVGFIFSLNSVSEKQTIISYFEVMFSNLHDPDRF